MTTTFAPGDSLIHRLFLRDAGDSDKALLFDLHERLFRHHIAEIWGWDTAQQIEIFEREWTTSRVRVIEFDDVFAGAIQQREEENHSFLLNFAVDAAFQSRGIGSQLLARLKSESSERGKSLRLHVFRTNPRAMEFYLRHGFTIARRGENGCEMVWTPAANLS